jgi:hypothetical protein
MAIGRPAPILAAASDLGASSEELLTILRNMDPSMQFARLDSESLASIGKYSAMALSCSSHREMSIKRAARR